MRSPRNRSILGVCEDFEGKRNAKITLLDSFLLIAFNDKTAQVHERSTIGRIVVLREHLHGLGDVAVHRCGGSIEAALVDNDLLQAVERIEKMERVFDELKQAAEQDKAALFENAALRELLRELTGYYDDGQWLRDYEFDERGLIPREIKKGVLSEDAVYNLLSEINDLEK